MREDERDALMDTPVSSSHVMSRGDQISWLLRIGTILGLAIVVGRVVQLQVWPGEKLEGFVAQRQTTRSIESERGDLLDRRGRVLATSRVAYRVIVDPVALENAHNQDPSAIDRVIVGLGGVMDEPMDQIASRIFSRVMRNREIRTAMAHENTSESTPSSVSSTAVVAATNVNSSGTNPAIMRLSRYLPMGNPLGQRETAQLRELINDHKLPGVTLEHTPIREIVGSRLLGAIIGKVGVVEGEAERIGVLGAESLFDSRLRGIDGSLTYVRDANGEPLWVQRGAWIDSDPGKDVRLSVDLEIQRMVHEQLEFGIEQADAAGGRAIVLNPHTGEILAMTDILREIPELSEVDWWDPENDETRPVMPEKSDQPRYKVLRDDPNRSVEPSLAYNRCLQDVYEPGSTLKPFAWTLAKTNGLLPDDEKLDIRQKAIIADYARRKIEDVYTYPDLNNWDAVLRYSSNIGMYYATSRLTHDQLRNMVGDLGFGSPTGIGLGGESSGIVTSQQNWSNFTQTSVGMGYEIAVTPIQMVRAFSVFARRGHLAGTLPEVRLTATGDPQKTGMLDDDIVVRRVFSAEAAQRTIKPMSEVVERMQKHMNRRYPEESKPKYTMYGKSGTSQIAMVPPKGLRIPSGTKGYYEKQHHSSFIVGAPAHDPQIVVLVVIDDVGPERVAEKTHFGSHVAGPVVRRIVEQVLPYLGVPADQELHAEADE